MTPSDSYITAVPIGPAALTCLVQAVADAQASDPFARVVVITDHRDVAQSVRHQLGVSGTVNVTVQTGRHLAKERLIHRVDSYPACWKPRLCATLLKQTPSGWVLTPRVVAVSIVRWRRHFGKWRNAPTLQLKMQRLSRTT